MDGGFDERTVRPTFSTTLDCDSLRKFVVRLTLPAPVARLLSCALNRSVATLLFPPFPACLRPRRRTAGGAGGPGVICATNSGSGRGGLHTLSSDQGAANVTHERAQPPSVPAERRYNRARRRGQYADVPGGHRRNRVRSAGGPVRLRHGLQPLRHPVG